MLFATLLQTATSRSRFHCEGTDEYIVGTALCFALEDRASYNFRKITHIVAMAL